MNDATKNPVDQTITHGPYSCIKSQQFSPQGMARSLFKQGIAVIDPEEIPELKTCFEQVQRCSELLQKVGACGHIMRDGEVHFRASPKHEHIPANRHAESVRCKRAQRACSVLAAVNSAWAKATGNATQPYDLRNGVHNIVVGLAVVNMQHHFDWITENDLRSHPELQGLVDYIMLVEAAHRECERIMAELGMAEKAESNTPDLRCVKIMMEWFSKKACELLDDVCRKVVHEIMPELDYLLYDRSAHPSTRVNIPLGSLLTLRHWEGASSPVNSTTRPFAPPSHVVCTSAHQEHMWGQNVDLRSMQGTASGNDVLHSNSEPPKCEYTAGTGSSLSMSMGKHLSGLLAVFYTEGGALFELQDHSGDRAVHFISGTNGGSVTLPWAKCVNSNNIVMVLGQTLEAATTVEGMRFQIRQRLVSHKVMIRKHDHQHHVGQNSSGNLSFAYELHAHPKTYLNPEEYGRVALGKSTPPLFRETFAMHTYLTQTANGRVTANRLRMLGIHSDVPYSPDDTPRDKRKLLTFSGGSCASSQNSYTISSQQSTESGSMSEQKSTISQRSAKRACTSYDITVWPEGSAGPCLARFDVAVMIMSYLDVLNVCRSSAVCQIWKQASNTPTLWHTVTMPPCITDRALLQMANRLRFTRSLNLDGCELVTDSGIETLLGDTAGNTLRRAEKESWDREAAEYGVPVTWYGKEFGYKGYRFKIYGFGKDESNSRVYVRGRTHTSDEVRVLLDQIRPWLFKSEAQLCSTGSPEDSLNSQSAVSTTCAHMIIPDKSSPENMQRLSGPRNLTSVSIHGCRLITIRGARMLENSNINVLGFPGPVTICVEAEGEIALRRLIYFKIRGNQPLKRLLRAYLSSAFILNPDVPLDFYFNDEIVYAHDTAQALGLRDKDVVRAALPRMRITVCGAHSLSRCAPKEVTVRASERVSAIVAACQEHFGSTQEIRLSHHSHKFQPVNVHTTPAQLAFEDGWVLWAWECGGAS